MQPYLYKTPLTVSGGHGYLLVWSLTGKKVITFLLDKSTKFGMELH